MTQSRPDKCPFCGAEGKVISRGVQWRCKVCHRAWLKAGKGITYQSKPIPKEPVLRKAFTVKIIPPPIL